MSCLHRIEDPLVRAYKCLILLVEPVSPPIPFLSATGPVAENGAFSRTEPLCVYLGLRIAQSRWRDSSGKAHRKVLQRGVRLEGDLYLPSGLKAGERRPGIVLCHGFTGPRALILGDYAKAF